MTLLMRRRYDVLVLNWLRWGLITRKGAIFDNPDRRIVDALVKQKAEFQWTQVLPSLVKSKNVTLTRILFLLASIYLAIARIPIAESH